jgi:hypothetical protein
VNVCVQSPVLVYCPRANANGERGRLFKRAVWTRLEPAQCLVVNSWYKKQNRLKTDGDDGLRNINQIVSWLLNRRYAITESGLDMALTNVQNNSSRKLFWHEGPKQDRAIWNGKLNHALNQKDEPASPLNRCKNST